MDIFNEFYKDKTVLVTGHTGFKGSWLSIWLRELGAEVIGYALDPHTEKDNFAVTGLEDKIHDYRGRIQDRSKLKEIFKTHQPDIVFHLSAQPLVRLSYKKPQETFSTNLMGTVNVLEEARRSDSVQAVVNITSDKCYKNKEWVWGYRENDELGGHDPYSASKACAEIAIESYQKSFFNEGEVGIASARAGNVIGGGDFAEDRLITDCIDSIKNDETIKIRSPEAVRPWQFVLEPLYGYLLLGKKLHNNPERYQGAWNFGPDQESMVTVGKLVDTLIDIWGEGSWEDVSKQKNLHEANILKLDTSKSEYYLNWSSKLSIKETVRFLVDWYNRDTIDYEFDVKQIKKYLKRWE